VINDTRGGAAVKKWAWIMLAAAVLVALCSPREVSQDVPREVSAAEAKEQLEMLGSREIDHLEIFDFGDEIICKIEFLKRTITLQVVYLTNMHVSKSKNFNLWRRQGS
jgi:hypothetical protein